MSSSPEGCTVDSDNNIKITNPFGTSGSASYTAGNPALSFIFSTGGINPPTSGDAGQFTVSTNYFDGINSYPIDSQVYANGIYIATPSVLTATVSSSSQVAYAD
jgi:hypothetical protein